LCTSDNIGGMKALVYLPLLFLSFVFTGCAWLDKPAPKSDKPATARAERPPVHRFENISNSPSPGIALDTVSGQYCRTWDWQYTNKPNAHDLNETPLCKDLYINIERNPEDPMGLSPLMPDQK